MKIKVTISPNWDETVFEFELETMLAEMGLTVQEWEEMEAHEKRNAIEEYKTEICPIYWMIEGDIETADNEELP